MRYSYAIKLAAAGLLLCLSMSAQSRSIPASIDNIRELADVVLVGEISEIRQASHLRVLQLTAFVREVAFDRNEQVAAGQTITFRFVQFPHAEGDFEIGHSYVVSLGRCKCGNYVLIGSQFVAKSTGKRFDTRLWLGFDQQTSFEEMRGKLIPSGERDSLLTDARCEQAWEDKPIP